MRELKNWYIQKREMLAEDNVYVAKGNVYRSPKFATGSFITTSRIEQVINYKDEERLEIHTRNSVYNCYWVDCEYVEESTQEFLMDYAHYRDKYMKKVEYFIEENSILLLLSTKGSYCFKQAFYKKNEEVKTLNTLSFRSRSILDLSQKILQSEEQDNVNIDIRFTDSINSIKFFYVDIPDGMKVYAHNTGNGDIRLNVNQKEIFIKEQERVQLNLTDCHDYWELIKLCGNDKDYLPRCLDYFCEEKVYREMEEDAINQIEKEYLLVKEVEFEKEDGKCSKSIQVCVGKSVEIAMMFSKYDLAKRLVEKGASIQLDRVMLRSTFKEENKKTGINLELTFMELLCDDWEIPDDLYALIWQKAKELGTMPLEKALHLQIEFDGEQSRKIAIDSVKRLRKQWEAAADELLLAWVKYYLEHFHSTETQVWEELFTAFPDKKKLIFEEIVAQHLRIYDERSFYTYPREADVIALPAYWRMCATDMDELVKKELVISVIHKMLGKEKNISRISNNLLAAVNTGKELHSDWLISELLSQVNNFGDLQVKMRDECVQKLFDYDEIDLKIWQILLKSTFVPTDYLGFYIELLSKEAEKLRYVLPLFITEKMRGCAEYECGL